MRRPSGELAIPPNTAAWRAFVDLELEAGTGTVTRERRPLREQHTVVGRSPGLGLVLDHDTVSRRHAELYLDPFGRWWIRDLGSTNGTTVNGEVVREHVLRPGDRIGIGDYRLRFHLGTAPEAGPATPPLEETLDGTGAPSWMRTLRDIEPPQISAAHLGALMSWSRRLLALERANERLASLCELLVSEQFHASLALVVRTSPTEPTRILAGPARPAHLAEDTTLYVSRGVLRRAVETNDAVLGTNLPHTHPSIELTLSADVAPLASIGVPIRREEGSMDVLYCNLPAHFGRADWLALVALVGEAFQQAEIAWTARRHAQQHAAIERELATARQIQEALVPREVRHPGLEIAVGFEPCRWVGGDYVDAVRLADGRVLCTIADVCGKGLQAALVTFSIHTMIRAMADSRRPLPAIMERLNDHLVDYLPEDSFVTLVSAAIDPSSGEVELLNAGHHPPLALSPEGASRTLGSGDNPPLGLAACELRSRHERLERGELLLLYTDGLTELRGDGGEMLGDDALGARMVDLYAGREAASLEQLAADLTQQLDRFRGEEMPEDDRTFLLARRA